jgi:hypothetical protein
MGVIIPRMTKRGIKKRYRNETAKRDGGKGMTEKRQRLSIINNRAAIFPPSPDMH